ncbi:helix-turn-helix domain-containing protein [Adlercreutzia sp. ZJ242]|uniref:helix-turn-helix domain-containing protein n=1 Tax=Adlercreutzia sp. ZJ242 TaxID=2709409 RepID=UPI0013E9FF66|nr:helix-turn-helix domain-containing protein [Adlercreutzia sp. ZJ242]
MFHKVKDVVALPGLRLGVQFANGATKIYDVKPLIARFPAFGALEDEALLSDVRVDVGGYGIIWSDELDLSCDELWEHGEDVETPFDGLMSFADASELWGLSESTLRKAVASGKIMSGVDARKYGKQWVVTRDAMQREYGQPVVV